MSSISDNMNIPLAYYLGTGCDERADLQHAVLRKGCIRPLVRLWWQSALSGERADASYPSSGDLPGGGLCGFRRSFQLAFFLTFDFS